MQSSNMHIRYGGGNSTNAEEVKNFPIPVFFSNPSWFVLKGILPPKTCSNTHKWLVDGTFSTSGRVNLMKLHQSCLSTLGQMSDPSLARKKATFSK